MIENCKEIKQECVSWFTRGLTLEMKKAYQLAKPNLSRSYVQDGKSQLIPLLSISIDT